MIKIKTWLPIFPGFYNTIFDLNDEMITQDLKDEGLTDDEIDKIYGLKCYDEMIENYNIDVCRKCTEVIESELTPLYVKTITYEKIVSPREYNFRNDSIDIEVHLTTKNIVNIKAYIKANFEKWQKYLYDRFTSYDGFISFHDNFAESDDWKIEDALKHTHRCGEIFEFILLSSGYNDEKLYQDIEVYPYLSTTDVKAELYDKMKAKSDDEILSDDMAELSESIRSMYKDLYNIEIGV